MTTAASPLHSNYIGRFAPSPTGPLHFGSLVAALASYLDARAQGGQWLLRVEDIDPPREVAGAAEAIIISLERHGLLWDGDILFQSQRTQAYREALHALDGAGLLYPCDCSRKQIQAAGGIYPGTCRPSGEAGFALRALEESTRPTALRVITGGPTSAPQVDGIHFDDLILGPQNPDLARDSGDFIVMRKDGLFAYQLAVVVDDIAQKISHVIRGSDLLDSTAPQIFLFQMLQAPIPAYGHIPVARDSAGQKLSKQQGASPIDNARASDNLMRALAFLGQTVPADMQRAPCGELLQWSVAHWDRQKIPKAL